MPLTEIPHEVLATYSFRRSVLDGEREYVLFHDRIEIREGGFVHLMLPLEAVRDVRVHFDPSDSRAYYKCIIRAAGTDIFLRHNSYRGFNDFEERTGAYATFVRTLLWRLAEYPGVRFHTGSWLNFMLVILLLAVFMGIGWIGMRRDDVLVVLVGLGLVYLCGWLMPRYVPRTFHPLDPPQNVLPGEKLDSSEVLR